MHGGGSKLRVLTEFEAFDLPCVTTGYFDPSTKRLSSQQSISIQRHPWGTRGASGVSNAALRRGPCLSSSQTGPELARPRMHLQQLATVNSRSAAASQLVANAVAICHGCGYGQAISDKATLAKRFWDRAIWRNFLPRCS
eukprot:7391847-Prymnesium_polylepis.7